MFSLENKTVLLTGAAGILGQQYAKILIEYGARVILIDQQECVYDLAKLSNDPQKIHIYSLDISQKKAWENLKQDLNKKDIHVNVFINHEGFKTTQLALEIKQGAFQ